MNVEKCLSVVALGALACAATWADTFLNDPWPLWAGSNKREGYSAIVGPRTPSLAWSLQVDHDPSETSRTVRSVLDRRGRLVIPLVRTVSAVDTARRSLLWEVPAPPTDDLRTGAAIVGDTAIYATGQATNFTLVCLDTATGLERWRFFQPDTDGLGSPAVRGGIVYVHGGRFLFARRVTDGSEVWTRVFPNNLRGSPSLDEEGRLFVDDGLDQRLLFCLDKNTGQTIWTAPIFDFNRGSNTVYQDLLLNGTWTDVGCYARNTGQRIWRHDPGVIFSGIALGPPGSDKVYAVGGNLRRLDALRISDGVLLWTAPYGGSFQPPLCDAADTVYFGTFLSGPKYVQAVNGADGTLLWQYQMPASVFSAPVLGPDGTLYIVCNDRNLYAFRDPHVSAILTDFSIPQGARASGGLLALSASDDDYFEMNSQAWFLVSEANLSTLELGAHTTKQNPTMMDIKVEARINQPVGRIKLALKNWLTGAWETVEVQETRNNEDITYWKTGLDCRKYVRPDGRIELQIKTIVNVPITEATFRTFLDQVDIQIRDI